MLALACVRSGEQRPLIAAARNVHKAFVYAAAWLDFDIEWIYPDSMTHICSCAITKEDVRKSLVSAGRKVSAVYITSPDYLGNIADIEGIASVCNEFKIPLLVDNAHGAYLAFAGERRHPIHCGASMCCDSAHKTLPVLTGGAYLHISKDADSYFAKNARSMLEAFASTSPSYLILGSLDLCNRYLADSYCESLQKCIKKIERVKKSLADMGIIAEKSEPLKIVVNAKKHGTSGYELAKMLRDENAEAEFYDGEYIVLMLTPENRDIDYERILHAFGKVNVRSGEALMYSEKENICVRKAQTVISVREAMLSEHEVVAVGDAVGRICASTSVSCPPAVPIAVCGEIITEEAVRLFERYNVTEISVVSK